jgi:hypothetical protein
VANFFECVRSRKLPNGRADQISARQARARQPRLHAEAADAFDPVRKRFCRCKCFRLLSGRPRGGSVRAQNRDRKRISRQS